MIDLKAGRQVVRGQQALAFVRQRKGLPNGDIDRIKRQQAFIASMAHAAISANTLANPLHLTKFLDAATKSLSVDAGLKSLAKLVGLAYQFRHIGLGKIQFVTTPQKPDPSDLNRVVWLPAATGMWQDIRNDRLLPKSILSGSLNAQHIPGVTKGHQPNKSQSAANLATGLCA